ncbi:MAG TPA: low specificity L-threonine aldolase [Chthoniobacterales bacterium]|nr:low specificity L-threonine aldolase [Chthoniobacterales bacterium]
MMVQHRYDLASDNTAGICPESWAALEEANADAAASYGDDRWTRRVSELVREIFETDCESFFVFNGTAANSLALAQLCRSYHSVICYEHSHIETDECGGPEFFSGGAKLLPTRGANGKLDLGEVAAALLKQRELHSPKPRVISITQSTELGTVYAADEIMRIVEFARERSMFVHMDGARFANAVATLGCAPKEITWAAGVDVLTFGGTKNGTGGGELVVFFKPELAREFDYRAKQAGQLASKMRFVAAPWAGLLSDDVWLKNARRANASAEKLAQKLSVAAGLQPMFPREANAIFLPMPEALVRRLHERGWHFYKFIEPDVYRVMCSWSLTEQVIDDFVADVKSLQQV